MEGTNFANPPDEPCDMFFYQERTNTFEYYGFLKMC